MHFPDQTICSTRVHVEIKTDNSLIRIGDVVENNEPLRCYRN